MEDSLVNTIIANLGNSTYKLQNLKQDNFRLAIRSILSNKVLLDTTITVRNDTLKIDKCFGKILSESKLKQPKLKAHNDIRNGEVQIKWLVENSSQDHSLKRMNKISRKYNFNIVCIGHHYELTYEEIAIENKTE